MAETIEKLGRFGHHPDPAIDFCVEVEGIEGEWLNICLGFENGTPTKYELLARVSKAMEFRVGGDLQAINAKKLLRKIEAEMNPVIPELLHALKLFVHSEKMARDGNPPQYADELIELGEAAIAKAEGRS